VRRTKNQALGPVLWAIYHAIDEIAARQVVPERRDAAALEELLQNIQDAIAEWEGAE
jgi:hypothetical protein